MDGLDLLAVPLRIAGVLYGIGAIALVRLARANAFLDRAIDQINVLATAEDETPPPKPDIGRNYWHFAGAALLATAAAAMILASRWAPWALAAVLTHQLLYFLRQHGRVRAARTPDEAREAMVEPPTQRAFYGCVGLTIYAAALGALGALS